MQWEVYAERSISRMRNSVRLLLLRSMACFVLFIRGSVKVRHRYFIYFSFPPKGAVVCRLSPVACLALNPALPKDMQVQI